MAATSVNQASTPSSVQTLMKKITLWSDLIIGPFLIIASIYIFITTFGLMFHGVVTQGTVIANIGVPGHNAVGQYVPKISFTDANNQTHEFESTIRGKHNIGDQITMMYDPANSQDAEINDPLTIYGIPAGCFVIGIILCTFAFISMKKKKENSIQ